MNLNADIIKEYYMKGGFCMNSSSMAGIMFGIFSSGLILALFVGSYLIQAFAYYKIAEKAGLENRWIAFIPVLQVIIMLHVIDKSAWNILLMFIPFVNVVFAIIWYYQFFKAFGFETILIVLSFIIPFVALGLLLYMAFSENCLYQGTNRY